MTEETSVSPRRPAKVRKRKSTGLKILTVILSLILFVECAYCVAIFTDIPILRDLRNIYISTAMSTLNHKWLATALIPGDVVQPVIDQMLAEQNAQTNLESSWTSDQTPSVGFSKDQAAAILADLADSSGMTGEAAEFFALFHELDETSTYAYAKAHPQVIENGWESFYVNEAGLDDEGTTIYTKQGDQVLAINARHGLLAIRITGTGYRGVLVIGKDPSRLKLAPSKLLGQYGQHAGDIAQDHQGLVAMTASGFIDGIVDDGTMGEGGSMAGAAMHSGDSFGTHFPWGYKRIELHTDNRLYITDAHKSFSADCTDACEFSPALVVDGQIAVGEDTLYSALNPRCVLGQTRDEAIMMLVIEGRLLDSLGTDAPTCAQIMARYDCYQAMNVDGGTSAILWYEGEYITRCSNTDLPAGRYLPNVWVYCSEPVPDS